MPFNYHSRICRRTEQQSYPPSEVSCLQHFRTLPLSALFCFFFPGCNELYPQDLEGKDSFSSLPPIYRVMGGGSWTQISHSIRMTHITVQMVGARNAEVVSHRPSVSGKRANAWVKLDNQTSLWFVFKSLNSQIAAVPQEETDRVFIPKMRLRIRGH